MYLLTVLYHESWVSELFFGPLEWSLTKCQFSLNYLSLTVQWFILSLSLPVNDTCPGLLWSFPQSLSFVPWPFIFFCIHSFKISINNISGKSLYVGIFFQKKVCVTLWNIFFFFSNIYKMLVAWQRTLFTFTGNSRISWSAIWATLSPLERYQSWMGSRMADSSIVQVTFPHRQGENRPPIECWPWFTLSQPCIDYYSLVWVLFTFICSHPHKILRFCYHGLGTLKTNSQGVHAKKQSAVCCPFGRTMESTVLVQPANGSSEGGVAFTL